MSNHGPALPGPGLGLSARLLALTTLFVMLAEILIYVPSISRFRRVAFEDQLEKANIAILAVRAHPDEKIGGSLAMELLFHAGAHAIVLSTPEQRMLMLGGDMPPSTDVTVDLRTGTLLSWIGGAFSTLVQTSNRVIRVVGSVAGQESGSIEILIDETPLRTAMYAYSGRILTLSVIISLITAGLVFLSLQWLMVRPIRQITDCMMRFREDPEDETATLPPSARRDEIGIMQRELVRMQNELRAALRQKGHLAALGAAVARINHDLRNTLATAVLASDRLAGIDDPKVKRLAPKLYGAIDRAVALCTRTLDFVQDPRRALQPSVFTVGDLVADLDVAGSDGGGPSITVGGAGHDIAVEGDRDQLQRVVGNLVLNAAQAGAHHLRIDARRTDGRVVVEVADDGAGIPDAVRDKLFRPFEGSGRNGGTGLGLAISREIVGAHGGDLVLTATGPEGTTFRIDLPATDKPPARRPPGGPSDEKGLASRPG